MASPDGPGAAIRSPSATASTQLAITLAAARRVLAPLAGDPSALDGGPAAVEEEGGGPSAMDADDGRQYLAATIGQQYFFEPSRVVLPGEAAESRSDPERYWQRKLDQHPGCRQRIEGCSGEQVQPAMDEDMMGEGEMGEGEMGETPAAEMPPAG